MRKRHRSQRRGYLLVTVVVLIAVASLMLGRMAMISMRVATVAVDEERDLRQRWAIMSLRRFSLDTARRTFGAHIARGGESNRSPFMWRDATLAGQTWKLVIADESSKLHVARFAKEFGDDDAANVIEQLVTDQSSVRMAGSESGRDIVRNRRWEGWLTENSLSSAPSPRRLAVATQRMTLWGGGGINVARCEPETLEVFWKSAFGRSVPRQMFELLRSPTPPEGSQLIQSLALRESQAEVANRWFATESDCFSVWIFCDSNPRVPASFYVEWGSELSATHRGYEY